MRITLFLLSLVAVVGGAVFLFFAKSPMDEIAALMLFVVAATLLSASAVVEAVARCLNVANEANELLVSITSDLKNARNFERTKSSASPAPEPTYVVRTGYDSSGPFPMHKIKELRRRGAIDDDTPVALEGCNEWRKTREIIGA